LTLLLPVIVRHASWIAMYVSIGQMTVGYLSFDV